MSPLGRWSWKQKIAAALGAGVALLVVLLVLGYALTTLPKPSDDATRQATVIQYAGGQEIGRVGTQNRQLVPLDKVSDPAQKAILAAEDRGFYSEPGISLKGILRALFTNLRGGGGIQQGGSTITQQYAKNAYLTQNRTYTRKVKELFIALKLDHTESKAQILENYLNTIYFGRGASGIQVAAKTYFGTTADKLTVAQGAVLAATIRSPAGYDPTRHPERAKERFAYVLDGMVKKGWLSADERAKVSYPTVLRPGSGGNATNDRSGWKGYILDQVEAELARNGFPEDRLNLGGYVVKTTIRRGAQLAAVDAVTSAVPPVKDPNDQHTPQAALVSIGAGTGEVWAYYGGSIGNGGTDFASDDQRQPGSSMKPYVLATALEQGKGLGTLYDGSSPQEVCGQAVKNDQGDPPLGQVDLVKALALSVNTVYYRLACDVGPSKVADAGHRAGITAALKEPKTGGIGAGIALGIYPISVLDQATGYATFAANGVHAETHFVKSVADSGGTVYKAKRATARAFGADITADATYAMQQVVETGTGVKAQLNGRPAAGKTGTSDKNVDAWFCGFTPQVATTAWVGRQDRKPLQGALGVSGGVYGGTVPAQIFKAYMDVALKDQPAVSFPPRANVGTSVNTNTAPPPPPPSIYTPPTVASPSPTPTPTPSASAVVTQAPLPSTPPLPTAPPTDLPPTVVAPAATDVPPPSPTPS